MDEHSCGGRRPPGPIPVPPYAALAMAGANPSLTATATSLLLLLRIERRHLSLFRDGFPEEPTGARPACVRAPAGPKKTLAGWPHAWATATKPNTLPSTTRFSLQQRGHGEPETWEPETWEPCALFRL